MLGSKGLRMVGGGSNFLESFTFSLFLLFALDKILKSYTTKNYLFKLE